MKYRYSFLSFIDENGDITSKEWIGFLKPETALKYGAYKLTYYTKSKSGYNEETVFYRIQGIGPHGEDAMREGKLAIQRYRNLSLKAVHNRAREAYALRRRREDNMSYRKIGDLIGRSGERAKGLVKTGERKEKVFGAWGRKVTEHPHEEYLNQLKEEGLL